LFGMHADRECHKEWPIVLPEASRLSREHGFVAVDMFAIEDNTVSTNHDDTATIWPQACNDAEGGAVLCGPFGWAELVPTT
jgi:hypothetical protein